MSHKTFISYKWSEARNLRDDILEALGDDATYYQGETSDSPDLSDTSTENIKKNLKDISRKNRISHTNGVVAVIMKKDGSYDWFKKKGTNCHGIATVSYEMDKVFDIIAKNHFNSNPKQWHCEKCETYDYLNGSYISFIEEENFLDNPQKYIDNAYDKSENNAVGYDIVKER